MAVVCDLREENWPSMNLVADMLLDGLRRDFAAEFEAVRVCPPMRRRFSRAGESRGRRFNLDRLLNRFGDYPRALRRLRDEFDIFHVVDHSYAQLLHELPAGRSVVTCHDLDTFRCLIDPAVEPRPAPFRLMTRRVLGGFRRAARVACDSRATRDELLAQGWFAPARVRVVRLGVHPAYSHEPDSAAAGEAARLLGPADGGAPELLHVGSTIARKRIDVLLEVFAAVRREFPRARLVRAGGPLTPAQVAQAARAGVGDAIVTLPFVGESALAAIYRRAALTLLPSEREGFGLPLVESLRCGTPVVASDLPVLRELGGAGGGGAAVVYRAAGDAAAWSAAIVELLRERDAAPARWGQRRAAAVALAAPFTWRGCVEEAAALYREVLAEREARENFGPARGAVPGGGPA